MSSWVMSHKYRHAVVQLTGLVEYPLVEFCNRSMSLPPFPPLWLTSTGSNNCTVHVTGCVRMSHCEVLLSFFPWAYQGKTLHSRSQELAVPYQPHTTALKRPSHWLDPLCPVSWLDKHKCTSCKKYPQKKDGKVYGKHCAIATGVLVFTSGRVIPVWLGGPYLRLDSGWQGGIIIIIWGRKKLVPVEYPEVGNKELVLHWQWWRDRDPGGTGSFWQAAQRTTQTRANRMSPRLWGRLGPWWVRADRCLRLEGLLHC